MLNWIILVAFNINYDRTANIYFYLDRTGKKIDVSKQKAPNQPLIDLCELIEHLYKIILGWIIPMDAKALFGEFTNPQDGIAETYLKYTQKRIDDKTDETLKYLRKAIQRKLCELGPTEDRPQIAEQQFLKKGEGIRPSSPKAVAAPNAAAATTPTKPKSREEAAKRPTAAVGSGAGSGVEASPRPASPRLASPRPASTRPVSTITQPLSAPDPESRLAAATRKPPPPPATPPPQSPRPLVPVSRPPAPASRPNRNVTTPQLVQSASKEESSKLLQQMVEHRGDSGARSPAFENRGDSGARSTAGDLNVLKDANDDRELEEFTVLLENDPNVRQQVLSKISRKERDKGRERIGFPKVLPGRSNTVSHDSARVSQFNRKGGNFGGKPRTRKRTRPSIIIRRHKTRRIAPKPVSLDKKYTRRNKNHKRTEQRSKTE
jgi:hypothetical protein